MYASRKYPTDAVTPHRPRNQSVWAGYLFGIIFLELDFVGCSRDNQSYFFKHATLLPCELRTGMRELCLNVIVVESRKYRTIL